MDDVEGRRLVPGLNAGAVGARLEGKLRSLTTTVALGQADRFIYPQAALLDRLDELLKMSEALTLEIRTR